MVKRQRVGNIIIPGGMTQPETHEYATARVFTRAGKDVEFLQPSRTRGSRTADLKIDGLLWEMKTPMGKTKKTVANALRRAVKQSSNVIIDTRQMKLSDEIIKKELLRNVPLTKSLKRLVIVSKESQIVSLK